MTCTPQTNATLEDIARIICEHDSFVTCGHLSPDGDCLGSQLALAHALQAMGKSVVNLRAKPDPIDPSLAFLPGAKDFVPARSYDKTPEVFLGLDVPSRERMGADACRVLDRCPITITIDHHASDITMCQHVYVDPDSASASMIVWKLVKLLVDKPPVESAQCAYTGLMTDTGGFRYQNADVEAFATAAELVECGAQPALAASNAFQSRSLASLEFESLCIQRMWLGADGACALSWLTQDDITRAGGMKSDADALVDVLRSVRGVRVACMLREQDGKVRGSLRAKDATDVSALARELGGGGHKAAAGITLDMSMPQAIEFMKAKVESLVAKAGE